MTSIWNDFNDAKKNSNLIPKGTLAKVRLTIRPGGFDDPAQGWTGGYATRGTTGAVYLNVEFTVLEGPYARRKICRMIGLYSPKGPDWANMGRSLVRGILNSARGISDKDNSPAGAGGAPHQRLRRSRRARIRGPHRRRHGHQRRRQERDPRRGDARPQGLRRADGRDRRSRRMPQQPVSAELSGGRAVRMRQRGGLGGRHASQLGEVRAQPCCFVPARNSSSSAVLLRSTPTATRWASRRPVPARPSCSRRSPAR